jgi:hypothetical protein
MLCGELEVVFEQEGLTSLSPEARQHLSECNACKHYFDDVTGIVALASAFPAEVEPPERVWISIREELQRENLFRPKHREAKSWWQSFEELFWTRGLATAAVAGMLVIAAFSAFQEPRTPVLEARDDPFSSTVKVLNQQEHDLDNMRLASTTGDPAVDTSLRQNLQQVDEFIADCEHRVKEVPSDDLTREYLTNAYQQKAELLSAMMDRGGSLN